jgi:cell division protein FtsB
MTQRRTPSGQGPGGRSRGPRGVPPRRPAPATSRSANPFRTSTAGAARTVDATRSGTRPASARRPAVPGAARRTSPPRPRRLTGRATALGLILLALMLAYAYPVRLYLSQEAQIQQLQSAQAAQRAAIRSLGQESAKWNDPAYIKAQARARFFMVPPGTKTYVVQSAPVPTTSKPASAPAGPWYNQLWDSLRTADDPGAAR